MTTNIEKNEVITETYLTEENLDRFKRMFESENKYKYYMKTIWLLRSLSSKACSIDVNGCLTYDRSNPSFPILETMNDLINCLIPKDGYFDTLGDYVKFE